MSMIPNNTPTGEPIPHDPAWWADYLARSRGPAEGKHDPLTCGLDGLCDSCQAAQHSADIANLPPARRRWVQLLADYSILGDGINHRHRLMEPAGTLPVPMTPAELSRLVGSFLRPVFAEPIMAALGPYIVQIVRAVIDERRRAR